MRRVVLIVTTTLVSIAIASWITIGVAGPEGKKTGEFLYVHRVVLKQVDTAAAAPPEVVWIGDSTTVGFATLPIPSSNA